MKKTKFKARLKAYLNNNINLDNKIDKLLASGCIDLENKADDYMLEKAAAYAILTSVADGFKPLHSQTMKEAENIINFI